MTRRRPTRDDLARHFRAEWLQERATAETLPCETCTAAAGETCRNVHTGEPLGHLPAHTSRMRAYLAA